MGQILCQPLRLLVALTFAAMLLASPAQAQDPLPERPFSSLMASVMQLPKFFCSEAERQSYLAELEEVRKVAEADADKARAYFAAMRQLGGARQAAGDREGFLEVQRELLFFQHGQEGPPNGRGALPYMTIDKFAEIEARIAEVAGVPVVDCSTLEAVQARRPEFAAVAVPDLPARLCSEAEREALRRQLEAARDAGKARADAILDYLNDLDRARTLYLNPPPPGHALHEANTLAEYQWARALFYNDSPYKTANDRLRALEAMPIVPCDGPPPTPAETPGAGTASPAFTIPSRPPLGAPPGAIPTTPICTEEERRARIEAIDAAIRAANERLATANSHLVELGRLSANATIGRADFDTLERINSEARSYQAVVRALGLAAEALLTSRREAIARPLDPCPKPEQPAETIPDTPAQPPAPLPDKPGTTPGDKKVCPPGKKRLRRPISIGSNGKVGSGARTKKKVLSTLSGLAGGLLGGGGGGGSGSGKGGPQLAKCKIKESEKTVFTDPTTGIALRVGAKRAGDTVVVFADVDKSPDRGTFQGGWVETPEGGAFGPHRADICDLWGEWSLTVSWTKTTYVDGKEVHRESGSYGERGKFNLPGMVSTDSAPAGLWARLGFSNASHGARKVALQYRIPAGELTQGPMRLLLHVTRPSRDPVDTQPFELVMSEGPDGIRFVQAIEEPCEPEADTDQRRLPSRAGHKLEFDEGPTKPAEVQLNDGKKVEIDDNGIEVEDKPGQAPAPTPPAPEDRALLLSPDRRATRLGRRGSARRIPS